MAGAKQSVPRCGWDGGALGGNGSVVKHKQLRYCQRNERVSPTVAVGELNFEVFVVKQLDHGSHLSPHGFLLGQVLNECHDIQQLGFVVHLRFQYH